MASFLRTCVPTGLSLSAVGCQPGAPPRGQQGSPALTLPHRRDGLSVLLMAVLCPFRRPSLCSHVRREFMRNVWLDLTSIVPATAYQ